MFFLHFSYGCIYALTVDMSYMMPVRHIHYRIQNLLHRPLSANAPGVFRQVWHLMELSAVCGFGLSQYDYTTLKVDIPYMKVQDCENTVASSKQIIFKYPRLIATECAIIHIRLLQ